MHLTVKQVELLTVIAKGDGPGKPLDLDQILDRIRYETTKQSLQFSIRALVARELIEKLPVEKRRGRQRRPIAATKLGYEAVQIKPEAPKPAYVVELEDDDLLHSGPEIDAEILEP